MVTNFKKQLNHQNQILILFKTLQLTVFLKLLFVVKMRRQHNCDKAKRDLNKIYTKYDTYKEVIKDIKTVEMNRFGMVYRRPSTYVLIYPNRFRQMKCLSLLSVTKQTIIIK